MTTVLWLTALIGLAPLLAGCLLLARGEPKAVHAAPLPISSAILCALAFNLTFLWQEVWLVIPKALTPGLHPVLYHNDHDWTGGAPTVELLQGSGAVATFVSGLAWLAVLRRAGPDRPALRLLSFWMAFQGLNQALSQLAIGSLLPANDVGRALTYLGVGGTARLVVLGASVGGLAATGAVLARHPPGAGPRGQARIGIREALFPAAVSILLVVPFRVPRDPVEVVLVPALVTLIGLGWLLVGAAVRGSLPTAREATVGPAWPALALALALAFFQLVLRPGVVF